MAEITAAAVKGLRDRTGLPMMDCKEALKACNGDAEEAIVWLRKRGTQIQDKRGDRETAFGRMGIFVDRAKNVGAMVELKCESAPVAGHEEFIALANGLAQQLANSPNVSTADELLAQPSPVKPGVTLGEQKDELFNRIREVFVVGRLKRIAGPCAAYSHNAATIAGVLIETTGGPEEAGRDICMHIAAMRPKALTVEQLPAETIAQERDILMDAARKEGKPEAIVEKMVEGRLRNFYAESVLLEQPFVKGDKETVKQYAKSNGFEVKQFVHWVLGEN